MKHLLPTTSELVDAFNDLLAQHDWQIRHVDVARLVAQHDLKALPFMFADMLCLLDQHLTKQQTNVSTFHVLRCTNLCHNLTCNNGSKLSIRLNSSNFTTQQ